MFFIIVQNAICRHAVTETLTFSDVIMWPAVCSPHIYFSACLAVMFPICPTWLDSNASDLVRGFTWSFFSPFLLLEPFFLPGRQPAYFFSSLTPPVMFINLKSFKEKNIMSYMLKCPFLITEADVHPFKDYFLAK